MRPPVLKADSLATVEIGMASTSRAKLDNIGNLVDCPFHQVRISNFLQSSSHSSAKYLSNSVLLPLLQLLVVPLFSFIFFAILVFNFLALSPPCLDGGESLG